MDLNIIPKLEKVIVDNMPAILTGVGVVGTLATAYSAHKAALKADMVVRAENLRRKEITASQEDGPHPELFPVSTKERILLTWPYYLEPVGIVVVTVGAIIMSNRISAKRAAALAAAYSIGEKRFEEYRAKMLEKLGVNKEELARAEISQEKINENPPGRGDQLIIIDGTDVMCLDQFTGRYFKSSMEKIKSAENHVNHKVVQYGYASLGDFYEMLGLPSVSMSEEVGWETGEMLELLINSALTPQGVPVLSIDFNVRPIRRPYGSCKAL